MSNVPASVVSTCTDCWASSIAVTRPSTSSACGHIWRSGTTACRGSSVPEAASGSIGV